MNIISNSFILWNQLSTWFCFPSSGWAPYYTLTHSPRAAIKRLRRGKFWANCCQKKKRAQSDRQSHSRQLAKRFPFPFGFWSQPTSSTFFGRQVCAFHLHRLARLKRKTSDTNPECYIWWQVATWRRHRKLRSTVCGLIKKFFEIN